jgi:hypothetical protein
MGQARNRKEEIEHLKAQDKLIVVDFADCKSGKVNLLALSEEHNSKNIFLMGQSIIPTDSTFITVCIGILVSENIKEKEALETLEGAYTIQKEEHKSAMMAYGWFPLNDMKNITVHNLGKNPLVMPVLMSTVVESGLKDVILSHPESKEFMEWMRDHITDADSVEQMEKRYGKVGERV